MWKILLLISIGGTILCSDVVGAESDYDPDELSQLKNALRARIDEITNELNEPPKEGESVERSKPLGREVECPACSSGTVCCRRGDAFACCPTIFNLNYKIGSTKFHEQIEVSVDDNTATEYFDDGRIVQVDLDKGTGAMYVRERNACYLLPSIQMGATTNASILLTQLKSASLEHSSGGVVYKLVDDAEPITDHSILPDILKEKCSKLPLRSAVIKSAAVEQEIKSRETFDIDLGMEERDGKGHCASNPCQHGGICYSAHDHFFCRCSLGYSGVRCEINANECASNPCRNGATCVDHVNSFSCQCLPGYTGTLCLINTDECVSTPCRNGGTCIDGIHSFTCRCKPGYTGPVCQADINECASNPCVYGSCSDRVNFYVCSCLPGFGGLRCQMDINECASGPCRNGGSCMDLMNQYRCICRGPKNGVAYNGVNCQSKCSDPGGLFGWGGYNNC